VSRVGDAARSAVTLLTVLPIRGAVGDPGLTMRLAPAVGLLLAVPLSLLALGADRLTSSLLAGTLTIAALALLTRGLHLDGLADLTDGLASYQPAARAREIMKSPEVGPLGVAAVVLVLLVDTAALTTSLVEGRGVTALVVGLMTGRLALTAACTRRTPAATEHGLGAQVAGTVARGWTAGLAAGTALLGTGVLAVEDGTGAQLVLPALAVVAGLGAARLVRDHAVRRLEGITGDVLGALVELSTASALIVVAIHPT
jgi:adenosylcobinamide-GDP ribazoletransferase